MPHLTLSPGETGIGKSTLMDTLFNTNFENFESSHFEPQVKLRAQTYDLQESNVRLRLTVVNTVGFGDQMNKQERWEDESVLLTVKKSDRLKVLERVWVMTREGMWLRMSVELNILNILNLPPLWTHVCLLFI